jgi:hypothetical protein
LVSVFAYSFLGFSASTAPAEASSLAQSSGKKLSEGGTSLPDEALA